MYSMRQYNSSITFHRGRFNYAAVANQNRISGLSATRRNAPRRWRPSSPTPSHHPERKNLLQYIQTHIPHISSPVRGVSGIGRNTEFRQQAHVGEKALCGFFDKSTSLGRCIETGPSRFYDVQATPVFLWAGRPAALARRDPFEKTNDRHNSRLLPSTKNLLLVWLVWRDR